ncbi:MAG: phenylacetate--CoA ligase family protein [Bacteroidota bacterium]|nr:phenylacetate--CoA ligase family protein [Bacteroidota bacterium]
MNSQIHARVQAEASIHPTAAKRQEVLIPNRPITQVAQEERSTARRTTPSLRERLSFAIQTPIDWLLKISCATYPTFLAVFKTLPPSYLVWASEVRARRAYYRAVRNIPAYEAYVNSQSGSAMPETDKESYIKKYPTAERCVEGSFFKHGTMIDESSGSTGTPYNWVRSWKERKESHVFISYFASYCYGNKPWVTINGFSMGAWATGINMGIALQKNGVVKNTGPDIPKILHTLRFFGTGYTYLITGYPPFLKHLIDVAEAEGFPLEDYTLYGLAGGEGMSEGLRDYLLRHFEKVYSGYGATDLEIGIAGETPISVALRRLARERDDLRLALFGPDSRLPMVFQYNPLMHHIEVNENNEVIFTISRNTLLSPRIRYNVHDAGGVMTSDEMEKRLQKLGIDLKQLRAQCGDGNVRLPFLWIYGRRDYTISVMGANIYPEDIEQCLYQDTELAQITNSFCLALAEGTNGAVRPRFLFEVAGEPSAELSKRFADSIIPKLVKLNADFREAWREYPETLVPDIQLYRIGEGPFAGDQGKIKQTRFLTN